MNEVLLMEEKKEKALLVGLNITSTARKIDDIEQLKKQITMDINDRIKMKI